MFTPTIRDIARGSGLAAALSLLAGCTGVLSGPGDSRGSAAPSIGNPTGNPSGGVGSGTGGAAAVGGAAAPGVDPGSAPMHRLNDTEYNNSVHDTLGVATAPADWSTGQGVLYGFDNIAELLGMDTKTYASFFGAASKLADEVMATPALHSAYVSCDPATGAACAQTAISAVGLKLFRRPLSADELTTYAKVFTAGTKLGYSPDDALKHVLRAMLGSAEFLYRIELDPTPTSLVPHKLGAYELGARLSYFLWSSAPDSALLAAAANGSLLDDKELGAQTDRLLSDPKGARFVTNFAGQWLGMRGLGGHAVEADVFPTWSPAIAAAEAEEAYRYFNEFVRGSQPWSAFLKADFNFVNPALAGIYGIKPPATDAMTLVQVTDDHRFGFLGLGAFLTISSYDHCIAPTLRARWILDQLMCSPPAPPPGSLMIPPLDGDSGTAEVSQQNIRERLEAHRKNAICASCHATFDAIGLALENFDAIGQYRATYPNGSAIDASGQLGDGPSFVGLQGLTDMLSSDSRLMSCVAEKLFIYGLGRGIADSDRPYLNQVTTAWRAGTPLLPTLIKGLVLADTFRFRRGEAQ
ncbi:MAG TPA: DUF1592 domain-containing protein [Polyangiaceae bacterium]|nr:DUF1592 domain-containing protein [Polyangiaceae bacterium]